MTAMPRIRSTRSLGERVKWRVRWAATQFLLRVVGRRLQCAACGQSLGAAFPLVWRGRVRIIGLGDRSVRVAFSAPDSLEFRHVELGQCPTAHRGWAHSATAP